MIPPTRRTAAIFVISLGALLAGCNHTPSSERDPQSAADAFFAAVETGNPHDAYDSGAFGFQAAQTFDGFISNAQTLGIVGGKPPVWTGKQVQGIEAHLVGTLVNRDGSPINVNVTMTQDGGAWKLFALETAQESQQTENHFTLVGKQTGINDPYHQPMPTQKQLNDLVRSTMLDFGDAVLKANFHAFYLKLSQEWRDGQRTSGGEASGVTEKMLKNHFQGFIDQKIDMTRINDLQPVYDQPPLINEDGLLQLQGHFNTVPYRLNFDLEYIYELPWWKLFGINVSLTK